MNHGSLDYHVYLGDSSSRYLCLYLRTSSHANLLAILLEALNDRPIAGRVVRLIRFRFLCGLLSLPRFLLGSNHGAESCLLTAAHVDRPGLALNHGGSDKNVLNVGT
jgi:hypothetical protein